MWAGMRLLVVLASVTGVASQTIPDATWSKMINDAGRQRMFTQRMAKAFLMIAKGIDSDAAKTDLDLIVGKFDATLTALIQGTGDYVAPPSTMIETGLQTVLAAWTPFKAMLLDNKNTIFDTQDQLVMGNISAMNIDCLKKSNAVVGRYVDAAKSYGAQTAGLQVDTAGRQRMLTQRMSKEAFFIGLEFQKSANLKALEADMQLFSDSHEGILRGVNFVGLPECTDMCTLWQMRTVTNLWSQFQPLLQRILDDYAASVEVLTDIAARNIPLLVEMNKGVQLFSSPDATKCAADIAAIDDQAWKNLINGGGKQRMMGQKASRLFLQVAKAVNTESSRVSLSTTLSTGGNSLRLLIEGSTASNYPAPPTQAITLKLIDLWGSWKKLTSVLTENANAAVIGAEVVHRVAVLSRDSLTSMNEAVEMYVSEALLAKPLVNSIVINIAGRQRMYQAKMSKEALLVTLDEEVDLNLANMETTIQNFLTVHWQLLLGIPATETAAAVPRTTDACMLQQMKAVEDRFASLSALARRIATAGRRATMDDLQELDMANPQAFATMNTAVGMYAAGKGTCTLSCGSEEFDFVFGELGRLRQSLERLTKDFLMTMQGLNSTDGDVYLPGTIAGVYDSLWLLKYGSTEDSIPTPQSQVTADKLFAVSDAFMALKKLVETPDMSEVDLEDLTGKSTTLAEHATELANLYIDDAWEADPSVEGARLNASGTLLVLIERMQKQSVMLQFADCAACIAEGAKLPQTIAQFDATYDMLVNGNAAEARRLQNGTKTDIAAAATGVLAQQMAAVQAVWATMKPRMTAIAEDYETKGKVPTGSSLVEAMDDSKKVTTAADQAVTLFSTSSRTTTSMPLDLLTPLPMTGVWSPGRTMKVASKLAEDIINQQQKIVPGFAIKNRYFDDKCDSQEGMRVVLKESVNDDYIALAGMGCSAVCESAAFAASSMNLPFLSYECNGEALSDTTQYADFVRMGTPLTKTMDIVKALVEVYKWPRITIVSGNPGTYRAEVEKLQQGLLDNGIASDYFSSYDATWDETRGMVDSFRAAKRRVVFLVGEESFFRRVICATRVTGANLGLTWLYEGVQSNKWWTVDDATLMALEASCDGAALTESFQGALNVANLGKPLPEEEYLALECFEGYTSTSILELLNQHLTDGYPVVGDNESMVARPHMEIRSHTMDGVCAFAKTMAHLMSREDDPASFEDLRKPSPQLYSDFVSYMKNGLAFQGVSGWVNFTGNDKPEPLVLSQVQAEDFATVGYAFINGSVVLNVNGGPKNDSWTEAHPDPVASFPYMIFQVLTPILCVCCPALAGCIRSA